MPAQATSDTRGRLGYTQVVIAPDTVAALTSLGVAPGVVPPGRLASADPLSIRFPITGFAPRNLRIAHSGGVTLTAGATTVTITDLFIDLGRGRVSGDVAGIGRADLFDLGGSDRGDLRAAELVLTADTAGALNGAFGVEAFTEGLLFGYATPKPFARR